MSDSSAPRRWRLLLGAAIASVVTLAGTAPAGAHAVLETLSPAPESVLDDAPREVVLTFSESISIPQDAVRVFDPSGRQLRGVDPTAHGRTLRATLPRLPTDGSYTVAWKAVSGDAHAVSGAYLFHLRTATLTEPVDVGDEGVATWPAVVRAVGSALALASLVLVLGSSALADRRRRAVAWAIVVLGSVVTLYGSVEAVGSSFSDGFDVALSTATGRVSAVACVVALVGLVASLLMRSARLDRVLAAIAVVVIALEGHAVALDPILLSASFTIVHVLAAVAWGAGLFWLERRTRRAGPGELRGDVERRSPWAIGAVVLLSASGLFLVLDRVPLDQLVSSWYGRLAILKLALLGAAVLLAVRNRVVLAPALHRSDAAEAVGDVPVAGADTAAHGPLGAVVRLRASVRLEMLVLAAALVAGAALSQIAPPDAGGSSDGGPFAERVAFGEGTVELTVDPGTRGMNEVHVTALGPDGRLMAGLENLKIELSLASENIGPLTPEMQPIVIGHSVSYARFPFEGEWTVLVTGTIGRFRALDATFTVPVAP